jgi:hypothetical protein
VLDSIKKVLSSIDSTSKKRIGSRTSEDGRHDLPLSSTSIVEHADQKLNLTDVSVL